MIMAADNTYPQDRVQIRQDGNMAVPNGKHVDFESGAVLMLAGVDVTSNLSTAVAHPVTNPLAGPAAGKKMVHGQATTVTASDTVVTGLTTVERVIASLEDTPVIGCDRAQATIGDQNGAPAAGSILIKTFCPTASGDATPKAATTFGKKVNWVAIGT